MKDKKKMPVCVGGETTVVRPHQIATRLMICGRFEHCEFAHNKPGDVVEVGSTPKGCPLLREAATEKNKK